MKIRVGDIIKEISMYPRWFPKRTKYLLVEVIDKEGPRIGNLNPQGIGYQCKILNSRKDKIQCTSPGFCVKVLDKKIVQLFRFNKQLLIYLKLIDSKG